MFAFPPRRIRFSVALACILVIWIFVLAITSSRDINPQPAPRWNLEHSRASLEVVGEPEGILRRVEDGNYSPNVPNSDRINATLLALVRNSEVDGMVQSMRDLERTFNHKFNYPWLFLNDEPFSDEFKEKTRAATRAQVRYEIIPQEHWDVPSWINEDLYQESVKKLVKQGVQFMDKRSYHKMCRWNSGLFYKHPALQTIKYYWRVEPYVHFFCDVDYDVFAFMQDNNKTYGFTIALYDDPHSITSLWPEVKGFLKENEDVKIHPNSLIDWVTDKPAGRRGSKVVEKYHAAHGYSTCHFWSNFEIGDMDFWRSSEYDRLFAHLDRSGGFFYERWGDAPVHTLGLALFEDASRIHWFRDIGYQHIPFFNCPNSPKCRGCVPGRVTDGEEWLKDDICLDSWAKYGGDIMMA